jgi:ferritin-like metal-binding protein YciE
MAKTTTMDDLLLDELKDLYDAEKQLTKALPKMAKASTSEELRAAFEEHLQQTQGHVERLEEVFEQLGQKSSGKKCAAMSGLIKEGEDVASDTDDNSVRDAGLIAAAQKVEHYEISGYGSVRAHARMLGHEQAVRLLGETLDEEKQTDQRLNSLAESMINEQAAQMSAEGGMERPMSGRSTRMPASSSPMSGARTGTTTGTGTEKMSGRTRTAGGGTRSS